MSAWLKSAFGSSRDTSKQTQSYLSEVHNDLPTLLTAQKDLPAEVKGSWKGLPAGITGNWKARGLTEGQVRQEEVPLAGGKEMSVELDMQYLVNRARIKPWSAKACIRPRLEYEAHIATNTPLREMKVVDGLHKFTCKLGGAQSLDEITFAKTLLSLLDHNCNVDFIGSVLECMDFKNSEALSVGEWARGLALFFKGTQEDKEHAIFNLLDQDADHYLSNAELKEYLKPFVKAMTPAEASVLQPWLLQHCTDQLLGSIKATTCRVVAPSNVDKYGSDMVSFEELFQWLGSNSLVDSLAQVIDAEVSRIHHSILSNSESRGRSRIADMDRIMSNWAVP